MLAAIAIHIWKKYIAYYRTPPTPELNTLLALTRRALQKKQGTAEGEAREVHGEMRQHPDQPALAQTPQLGLRVAGRRFRALGLSPVHVRDSIEGLFVGLWGD